MPANAATGTVGEVPSRNTPWLLSSTPMQNVRRLVPCGDLMYAVGTISAVGQGSHTYTRGNAFSFSQTTGAVTAWNPAVNGPVNDIALSPDCRTAYLGGSFTSVHGTSATNIAAVDTTTGAVKSSFRHNSGAAVYTVDYTHGQILVGGAFGNINGAARTEFASLDPSTGTVTPYANLAISGRYPRTSKKIDNSQLSHSGNKLLVEGVFTSIGGHARQQVAVFDLGATTVTLDGWNASGLAQSCVLSETYYTRSAAWSPDDQTIYGVSTGYHPLSGPGSSTSQPRAGLCDAAFAFSAASTAQNPLWINYTGCDSYYGVVADSQNVYVGGHERWANNPNGCDSAGPGALSRPGLADLDPVGGSANSWNPTRALGHGADDLVLTPAGLWVASDTFKQGKAQMCGHQTNHGGICFLPY
ncbi:MAG TPA: hypothetical protein VGH43_11335 [Jatrophihabitans sp.]